MKKTRTRQRSHRTSTPSVICLPPPKPPLAVPRKEPEVERALRLPQADEPLVAATRQARRQAQRAEAKGMRSPTPQAEPEFTPLPANMAPAKIPSGLFARVNAWLSRLIPVGPARKPNVSQEALAEQMVALRSELAMVQGRLDRMIKAVSHR